VEFLEEFREEDNTALPLAVLMKVEFTDGTTEQWLRRVAGVSKNSTFGFRENKKDDSQTQENGAAASSAQRGGSSSGGSSVNPPRFRPRTGGGGGRR
jgi:hypothetical protein